MGGLLKIVVIWLFFIVPLSWARTGAYFRTRCVFHLQVLANHGLHHPGTKSQVSPSLSPRELSFLGIKKSSQVTWQTLGEGDAGIVYRCIFESKELIVKVYRTEDRAAKDLQHIDQLRKLLPITALGNIIRQPQVQRRVVKLENVRGVPLNTFLESAGVDMWKQGATENYNALVRQIKEEAKQNAAAQGLTFTIVDEGLYPVGPNGETKVPYVWFRVGSEEFLIKPDNVIREPNGNLVLIEAD